MGNFSLSSQNSYLIFPLLSLLLLVRDIAHSDRVVWKDGVGNSRTVLALVHQVGGISVNNMLTTQTIKNKLEQRAWLKMRV
jgi:hypothetical protein